MQTVVAQCHFLRTNRVSLERWLSPDLVQGDHSISLEQFLIPESKKSSIHLLGNVREIENQNKVSNEREFMR